MQIIKIIFIIFISHGALFASEKIVCQPLEKVVFTCKIQNQDLQFCQGKDKQIRWLRGKFVSAEAPWEITAGTLSGTKQAVISTKQEYRKLTTTVFINQGDLTYGLSTCSGMFCGEYAMRPWVNIYNKGQKISTLVCDENTWDEGFGGYSMDKEWNPRSDDLYIIEPSTLDISISEPLFK